MIPGGKATPYSSAGEKRKITISPVDLVVEKE